MQDGEKIFLLKKYETIMSITRNINNSINIVLPRFKNN